MTTTHTGYCKGCGYHGPDWTYVGPQYEDPDDPPVFHLWNCPNCHSTKTSAWARHPPR